MHTQIHLGPSPNPRGVTRCAFWDKLAEAKRAAVPHWSYDSSASRAARKAARTKALSDLLERI